MKNILLLLLCTPFTVAAQKVAVNILPRVNDKITWSEVFKTASSKEQNYNMLKEWGGKMFASPKAIQADDKAAGELAYKGYYTKTETTFVIEFTIRNRVVKAAITDFVQPVYQNGKEATLEVVEEQYVRDCRDAIPKGKECIRPACLIGAEGIKVTFFEEIEKALSKK